MKRAIENKVMLILVCVFGIMESPAQAQRKINGKPFIPIEVPIGGNEIPAHDQTPDNCFFGYEQDNAQVLGRETASQHRGCSITIGTRQDPPMRKYTFTEDALILITDNYSASSDATHAFFVFPRKQKPVITHAPGRLTLQTSSGDRLVINTETHPPTFIDDPNQSLHLSSDPNVNRASTREIKLIQSGDANHLIMDCGVADKRPAFVLTDRQCTLSDGTGKTCTLSNTKLFRVTDPRTEAVFKYPKDADFYRFLKTTACAGLRMPETTLPSTDTSTRPSTESEAAKNTASGI